ncbi:MAG: DPP IV N-terminal domain-containing protein [Bacteroidota bacterium]|nr:DPP IV N-terminal domain-containing protein [Bacteroidota bacterium]
MQFNKSIKTILFALLLLGPIIGFAQKRKELSLKESVSGSRAFTPNTLNELAWRPNHDEIAYLSGDFEDVIRYSVDEKKEIGRLSLKSFPYTSLAYGENIPKADIDVLQKTAKIYAFNWIDDNHISIELNDNTNAYTILWDINSNTAKAINYSEATVAENVDVHVKTGNLAYTYGQNLFVRAAGGKLMQITRDSLKGKLNGTEVHRSEFGITKGTFWSVSGKKLAFYRKDESMVTQYPIMNLEAVPGNSTQLRYPMAGQKSHHASVWIYDLQSKGVVKLNVTGDPEQYLTNIAWSPDDNFIYMAIVNRDQNLMQMHRYDVNTGADLGILFEEKDGKYIEPLSPAYFVNDEADKFIWQSNRSGYNHCYLYDALTGKMLKQITSGNWEVTEIAGVDDRGRILFIEGTMPKTWGTERQIYRYDLRTGKNIPLTVSSGIHKATISYDGEYMTDNFSSINTPRIINIVDGKRGQLKSNLLTAENPLAGYEMPTTQVFRINADDGTPIAARIILPPNMDSSKKYPVLVYVYGGPHAQMINAGWLGGSQLWLQRMAQRGYIIFTVDNRGSDNRGKEFEQVTHRQLGTVEMADQLAGIKYLRKLPFVDTARMGIHGWSFGGFMTISLMTKYPGVFKVAVAGGPVIDWKYYEVMYTERYMDTPEQNKEGYEKASLINQAKNLNGKLLIIHGMDDDVVVQQHSLLFVRACIRANKQVDYFVYPGQKHNVQGIQRNHLVEKIGMYFDDYLK